MKQWMKAMLLLVLLLCGLTLFLYVIFFYVIGKEYYPIFLPAVALFYLLESLFFCFILYDADKKGNDISLKKTITLRIVRVVGSIALLTAGALVDKAHIFSIAAVVAVYYLTFLIMESKIIIDINKRNSK